MSLYIPEQGDIIWLSFDPASGQEIIKRRPALVISKKIFNQQTGFALVAPITSTQRDNPLTVALPKNLSVSGFVLTYQIRTVDFRARKAERIEACNTECVKKACNLVQLIASI